MVLVVNGVDFLVDIHVELKGSGLGSEPEVSQARWVEGCSKREDP